MDDDTLMPGDYYHVKPMVPATTNVAAAADVIIQLLILVSATPFTHNYQEIQVFTMTLLNEDQYSEKLPIFCSNYLQKIQGLLFIFYCAKCNYNMVTEIDISSTLKYE